MEATANYISTPRGAIDLGSNSFRLLIGTFDGQNITALVKELRTVRLAKGLKNSGTLSIDVMRKGLETLTNFKSQIDKHRVTHISCFGTEALRQAKNSRKFISAAQTVLGCDIQILTGSQEAELCSKGVLAGLHDSLKPPTFIVDVGGGSTEISYINYNSNTLQNLSLPLGAVTISEYEVQSHDRIFAKMNNILEEFLRETAPHENPTMVSSGGTATTIAMLDLKLASYDEQKVHGYSINKHNLDLLADRLSGLEIAERNSLPGLEDGRGEIIVGGCKIYQEIIATIGVEGMIVSDWGLLEGILLEDIMP